MLILGCAAACRSEKVPEPAPATVVGASSAAAPPVEPPRFAWQAPVSIPADETFEQQGRRIQFRYWIDVCPGKDGGIFLTQRDFRVDKIDDVSAASDPELSRAAEQAAASAAALPTMVIDHNGSLVDVSGVAEMMDRLRTAYPKQDFSPLKSAVASGQTTAFFKAELGSRWQSWVNLWLRFDPTHASPQPVMGDDVRGSPTLVSFKGYTPERRLRFSATRTFNADEARQLSGYLMTQAGATRPDLEKGAQSADVLVEVETDWPAVRPWSSHTRKTLRGTVDGKEIRAVEDSQDRFDWKNPAPNAPKCP